LITDHNQEKKRLMILVRSYRAVLIDIGQTTEIMPTED
jgi:hypothetical protein